MASEELPSTASRLRSRSTVADDFEELALLHPSKRRMVEVEPVSRLKKVSSTNEYVVELNQAAIRLFHRGALVSAQKLFSKALSLLQTDPVYPTIAEQTIVGHEEPPKQSYQRLHFDEGIEVYTCPETVSVDDHAQTLVAVLHFNIGQVKRRLGDLDTASRFFESALETLLLPFGRKRNFPRGRLISSVMMSSCCFGI